MSGYQRRIHKRTFTSRLIHSPLNGRIELLETVLTYSGDTRTYGGFAASGFRNVGTGIWRNVYTHKLPPCLHHSSRVISAHFLTA